MAVTRYLADKSALARLHLPSVRDAMVPLMKGGLVAICGATELEIMYSARNLKDRQHLKESLLAALCWAVTPDRVWEAAADLREALTAAGQHRSTGVADLIVAVTASANDLTVLHYDRDFDTIRQHTRQPTRWVVPPGSAEPSAAGT